MSKMINGFFPGYLQSDTTVAGCIDIYESVWPDPQDTISSIEEECKNPDAGAFWTRAETIGSGAYQNSRTNLALSVTHSAMVHNNPLLQNIHNQFNMLLLASVSSYQEKYNISENLTHEQYSILKYLNGTNYKLHYDSNSNTGRAISAVCYLNNDFIGGELEFPNFKIKIKPEPGMLILFPSNFAYSHIAHPVTDGIKYNIVTWIRDS
jgi:predicted 2-oxoglutarate/Fe(II)-dependent dioxygenase YbiX